MPSTIRHGVRGKKSLCRTGVPEDHIKIRSFVICSNTDCTSGFFSLRGQVYEHIHPCTYYYHKHALHWKKKSEMVLVAQSCLTLCDSIDYIACQTPLSMEFFRQEYWICSHSLLQGIVPNRGLNLCLLHCRQILYQGIQGTHINIYLS